MENYWELSIELPNDENQNTVNEFLLNLKLANYSQITVDIYRCFLEKFFSDMPEPFTAITSETILQWFNQNEGHLKENTVSLRLSILSSFYTFCVQEEYMEQSPMKSRWFPRLPQSVPKYLEKGELAKVRIKAEESTLREQAMIEFMLSSGCRVSEVSRLDREDVDLENRVARVLGKGKKIREVHFSEKAAFLLKKYMENSPQAQALFVRGNGKRIGTRRIQQIVKEVGEEAGLSARLHPHRLRHTFATELLTKGAELSFIADELGHRSMVTTRIYARLPKSEIISLYRKYMG